MARSGLDHSTVMQHTSTEAEISQHAGDGCAACRQDTDLVGPHSPWSLQLNVSKIHTNRLMTLVAYNLHRTLPSAQNQAAIYVSACLIGSGLEAEDAINAPSA